MLRKDTIRFKVLHVVAFYAIIMQSFFPFGSFFAATGKTPVVFSEDEQFVQYLSVPVTKPVQKAISEEPSVLDENIHAENIVKKKIALAMPFGGPGQSETSGFSLNSTGDMVDPFTGDFSYSIPLADVEGYPIVISYNSNITMNSEASWVGLGWDLNVGAVSREMRGLPDEFNGEQEIIRKFNQNPDDGSGDKFGGYVALKATLFGGDQGDKYSAGIQAQLTALKGKYHTNYLGDGKTFDFGLQASPSAAVSNSGLFVAPSFGLGYSSDSKRGVGTYKSYGLSAGLNPGDSWKVTAPLTYGFTKSFHSRAGMLDRSHTFGVELGYGNPSGASASYGATSTIPYGTLTSVPSVKFNSSGSATRNSIDGFFGLSNGKITAKVGIKYESYDNNEVIALNSNSEIVQPAIGYFHSGKWSHYVQNTSSYGSKIPLMDFNRTNDMEYSEEMKHLAFSVQTYDIFRANASGLGATFRARRSDVGTYKDQDLLSNTDQDGVNFTVGAVLKPGPPTTIKGSIEVSDNEGNATAQSGNMKQTDGTNVLDFYQEAKGTSFDSRVYFKGVGEMTPENLSDFNTLGGSKPTHIELTTSGNDGIALTGVVKGDGFSNYTVDKTAINALETPVRAMRYQPFTATEYASTNPYYYSVSGPGNNMVAPALPRLQSLYASSPYYKNHLSAVEIVNTDGIKYVFGIPAYELNSSQVSFSMVGLTDSDGDGVASYLSGDNSTSNVRGVSHYYDKTTVPAYPHSFLLTEMRSSDYVDRTSNGPTLDDVGNYYKFNYTRVYDSINPYKWRFPMEANSAYFDQGLLGTTTDDMGNYSYGEKEIWYTHSIESKNLIAEFQLTPREDACGVIDENGGININMRLSKLSKIVIYNRSERLGPNGSNAVPLQTVEFEYSYELCKNNPANSNQGSGNEGGKLTLKKIRSYAGTSFEMGLYAYEFYYDSDQNKNFSYRTDSWGNWKPANAQKPNSVYPYTEQNASNPTLDDLAQNWKLMRIVSPTRGEISIDYEADCYSTVQDKRAMQMLDIVGFTNMMDLYNIQSGSFWNINTSSNIYLDFNKFYNSSSQTNWSVMDNYMEQFGALDRTNVPNNVVVFKLSKQINSGLTYQQASDELKKLAFTDGNKVIEELYLKLHVLVKNTVNELIPAFGKISADFNGIKSIGVMPKSASDANYEYGYVVLDPALVDDEGKKDGHVFNALQKSAIQFIRRNLPDVVYGAIAGADGDIILDKAVALNKDDIDLLMNRKSWAKSIYTDFSSVRLYVASGKKYGGLGRVRTITYKDNWTDISGENIPGTYVWQYDYNEAGTATSGNAAFEPHSIIDESALYMWDTYVNFREKYPDESKFTPTPIAAILYPAPIIGYEWIKTSMPSTTNNGYSISEFHTSRTHPVIVPPSSIDKTAHVKKPEKELGSLLSGKTSEKFGFSEGFVIETNDFHGKPDESIIYAIVEQQVPGQGVVQTPVVNARTIYEYADLNQKHPTLGRTSETMTNEYLAQEADIHADSRYVVNNYELYEVGVNVSLTWQIAPPSPIPFPFLTPVIHRTSRRQDFYSTTLVKHINRSAIVTSIKTESLGSINTARNEVYDYYTGNTIVSSLNDEYNDRLYSMTAPSHWYYKELRELYSSQDAVVTVNIAADGTISNADEFLTPGDYVEIVNIAGTQLAWIAKHSGSNNGDLFLMGPNGQVSTYVAAAGSYQLKIIKSNRDNRLNESMMSIVTKKNPINGTTCSFPTTEIISADVLTYKDRNSLKCGTPQLNIHVTPHINNNEVTLNSTINPYMYGVRGDLVPDGSFAWQSERNQTPHPYKTRFDGTFQTYTPFYSLVSGKWTKMVLPTEPPVTTTGWRKMGEATVYNEYGAPLESKDQLDIYSSIIYGYNRTFALVPVGQAVNARQQEIGFDGFEDYAYYGTLSSLITNNVPHFDFKSADDASAQVSTDQTTRHSGLHSLKITGNSNASVVRKVAAYTCEASSVVDPRCNCFKVDDCACIKPFEPTPGDYIISVWVRNTNPLQSAPGTVTTIVAGSGMATDTKNFTATGPVIDGWQRLEGKFTIPATGAETVTIRLNHVSGTEAYFDDVRVHPFLAGMTTTVYDPKTLLPMATHDGFNFTTFYNYDENLNLVRVRVETVEGIKTVSESEMGSYKR